MAIWQVVYRVKAGKTEKVEKTAVDVEGFDNAAKLRSALENGEVPNYYFERGSIVSVQKVEAHRA